MYLEKDIVLDFCRETQRIINQTFYFLQMQMMAREDIMKKFNANDFDIIIIDEVHRAGS